MDFNLTDEQEALRKTARKFSEQEIISCIQEHDDKEEFPWKIIRKMHTSGS